MSSLSVFTFAETFILTSVAFYMCFITLVFPCHISVIGRCASEMCVSVTAVLLNGTDVAVCMSSKSATCNVSESAKSLSVAACSFGATILVCMLSDSATSLSAVACSFGTTIVVFMLS